MNFKSTITFIILLTLMTITTFASSITVSIDGEAVYFDQSLGYPFIDSNGRTLVPFRAPLEKFGAKVSWDPTNQMAIAEKNNIVVKVPIGENYIYRNDVIISTDTVALIKNGRTYLPIRAVMEAFGCEVSWNEETQDVSTTSPSYPNVKESYIHDVTWGLKGSGTGEFNGPYGIAVDSNDFVYVTDTNNYRVQKFTSTGQYLNQFDNTDLFASPLGIDIDFSGNIFLTKEDCTIQVFDPYFNLIIQWGETTSDSLANEMGLGQPHNIAVDSKGFIFVVNWSGFVKKFSINDKHQVQFETVWGFDTGGDDSSMFYGPRGIAVDSDGFVYVADEGHNCIQKFTTNGDFVSKWGIYGNLPGEFNGPYGITIDSEGYAYVADTWNRRIQKFDSTNHFISQLNEYMVVGDDGNLSGDQLGFVRDIAVDSKGNVYVTDFDNNRVVKFSLTNTKNKIDELYNFYQQGISNGWFKTESNDALKTIDDKLIHISELITSNEINIQNIYDELQTLIDEPTTSLEGDLGKINDHEKRIYFLMKDYESFVEMN